MSIQTDAQRGLFPMRMCVVREAPERPSVFNCTRPIEPYPAVRVRATGGIDAVPRCARPVWSVATGEPVSDDDVEAIALEGALGQRADLLRHGGVRGPERQQPVLARRMRQSRLPAGGALSYRVASIACTRDAA